jgi:hypothetical protein
MKTSNILLLSFLALILLSITIIIFAIGRDMNYTAPDNDHTTWEVEQVRNLPHFNKVKLKSNFKVYYIQDTFQKVLVKADSNLIGSVVTEVDNGKLLIRSKKHLKKLQNIEIFVTTDSINEIQIEAGGTFKTSNKIKVHQLDASGSAGAILRVDGTFVSLNLTCTAGCVSDFSGKCKNLKIESSAGSILNADSLVTETGIISSSSASIITVNVCSELSIDASSASIIKYLGNPQLKSFDISSGAQFIKLK